MNEKFSLFEDLYTGLNQAIEFAKGTKECNVTVYTAMSVKLKGHRKIIASHSNSKRKIRKRFTQRIRKGNNE